MPATVVAVVVLSLAFGRSLLDLLQLTRTSDLFSHIMLIPLATGYLIYLRAPVLPKAYATSWWQAGLVLAVAGFAGLGFGPSMFPKLAVSATDQLAWQMLAYYALLVTIGFLGLGGRWMASVAFPVLFLGFIVPWPDAVVHDLEYASQVGSSWTAQEFLDLTGMSYFRDGFVFELAGIRFRVAEECSGIRSTVALMVSALLASQLLLRNGWHRALVIALVIPIGLIRNGARIWFIGWLCVEHGAHMINSVFHSKAGPPFFVLSLVPLVGVLWLLMRRESRAKAVVAKS